MAECSCILQTREWEAVFCFISHLICYGFINLLVRKIVKLLLMIMVASGVEEIVLHPNEQWSLFRGRQMTGRED